MSSTPLIVLFRKEEESWPAFVRRIREAEGEVLVVLSGGDCNFLADEEERKTFLAECAKLRYRLKIAAKHPGILAAAKALGIKTYSHAFSLRRLLKGHPQATEVMRVFTPHPISAQWKNRLQTMGILSLPRLRISILIGMSVILFAFVFFRLLPSAEVKVWPRQDVVSRTTNVILVQSGATGIPSHARTLPLIPLTVKLTKTLQFDQISKEFTGTNARTTMSIVNDSDEEISLIKGTRLLNQAGMIFRLKEVVTVAPHSKEAATAEADSQDIYGEDIGDRGNLPPGVKWDIPGLSADLQKTVHAVNTTKAQGGRTSSRRVLQQKDLQVASELLKSQLLTAAQKEVEATKDRMNLSGTQYIELLTKNDVIRKTYSGFVLPTSSLGKAVPSVPVTGTIIYTMYGYDATEVLDVISKETEEQVMEGKKILEDSLKPDRLRVYIIAYADNLSWIKITADLSAQRQFILDPLTPTGAKFAKEVRDTVAGKSKKEALSVLKNLTEVEKVEVSLWPPWSRTLPSIPSHIAVSPQ
jgi:hypothetical protein